MIVHECPWDSLPTISTVTATVYRCTSSPDNPPNQHNMDLLTDLADAAAAAATVGVHTCQDACGYPWFTTCWRDSAFQRRDGGAGGYLDSECLFTNLGHDVSPCSFGEWKVMATCTATFLWQVTCNCD